MFHCGTPKKRKNDETSPDNIELPTFSKRARQNEPLQSDRTPEKAIRTQKLRAIINQEFKNEIKLKEIQIEQIDDRLDEAHTLLNRLRYAIVAEYYKKQEQPQLMAEATKTIQNASTSLQNNNGLQIAMHPSLKKIIGKRPTNLEDIMKTCPKRVAAQIAKHGICTKTTAKRKDERLRKESTREQDMELDHSKIKQENCSGEEDNNPDLTANTNCLEATNSEALNSGRIVNKSKYLFVVGNTSKYISNADSQVLGNVSLTHKWIVYVQARGTDQHVSKFIKKVRFFLHPSYRPYDVIDIKSPPYQVARRGWGEFPMRIQLFFHDKFQQKPVQLVHKVVLDTTKSGRHTVGAETIMEIWLRDESFQPNSSDKKEETDMLENSTCPTSSTSDKKEETDMLENSTCPTSSTAASVTENLAATTTLSKPRTISPTSIKEPIDDNFMDFLNKIDETRTSICSDIEKLQPTVVVNESLEPSIVNVHQSPTMKNETSPFKKTPAQSNPHRTRATSTNAQCEISNNNSSSVPKSIKDANTKIQVEINTSECLKNNLEESKKLSLEKVINISNALNEPRAVSTANSSQASTSSDTKTILNSTPSGKVFSSVSGTVILPVTKPQHSIQEKIQNQPTKNSLSNLTAANAVFQKKVVQVIDAQGKIKNVQMLVVTSKALPVSVATQAISTSASTTNQSTNAVCGNISTKPLVTNLVTSKPIIIKSIEPISTNSCTITPQTDTVTNTAKTETRIDLCVNKNVTANNLTSPKKSANSIPSKNIVFQKDGKLYIIDPLQMKLKQQQKNQISLLKPQIKQQQQQQQQPQQEQPQSSQQSGPEILVGDCQSPLDCGTGSCSIQSLQQKQQQEQPQQSGLRPGTDPEILLMDCKPPLDYGTGSCSIQSLQQHKQPQQEQLQSSRQSGLRPGTDSEILHKDCQPLVDYETGSCSTQSIQQQEQQPPQQQHQSNIIRTIATDHDYVNLMQKPEKRISRTQPETSAPAPSASLLRRPHLQLGMRNSRLNGLRTQDLLQLRRVQFEKRFFRINFSSMRSAVEYLLRRLPLNVSDKDSPAATFPFACTAPQDFHNLATFKQRSREWLRAKFIANLLENSQSLRDLDSSKEDIFWSTREIATFARHFAYTPPIKSLGTSTGIDRATKLSESSIPGSKRYISAIIKNEMQSERLQIEYDSLSPVTGIQQWLERMQRQLQQQNLNIIAEDEIVIDDESSEDDEVKTKSEPSKTSLDAKEIKTKRKSVSPVKFESINSHVSFLPPLARLETASQFVDEVCRDLSIRLQPEEIVPGIMHPVAQTLLAQILKVFVDRLLRQAIANQPPQTQDQPELRSATNVSNSLPNAGDRCISSQDVRKAILENNELDFLTNQHLGVSANQIKHE